MKAKNMEKLNVIRGILNEINICKMIIAIVTFLIEKIIIFDIISCTSLVKKMIRKTSSLIL
ncbi:MAG: hypothetical protein LBN01_04335 [Endomicrobium sp.]|jgi:hypothetical protein|nr:hypothetical protein [Endomicrobium sp.]